MPHVSSEARIFLSAPPPRLPYRLDPDEIDAWRAAIREGFAPAARQAITKHGVTTREIELGGVACLEILPSGPAMKTILYCYGGGFVSGSPFEDLPISAALAARCEARVVAPHYRLAPEHPHPAAMEDGLAVARLLSSESGPLALAGESAGGNLALALAVRMREEGLRLPNALALLSPWCDLTNSGDSLTANDGRDPTLANNDVVMAATAYAGSRDLADPGVSPLFAAFGDWVPSSILTTGTRDLLLSPTVQLATVLRQAGARADLRVWEEMWHVFEFYEIPEADRSLREIAEFLNAHL